MSYMRLIKTTVKEGGSVPDGLEIIQVIREVVMGRERFRDIAVLEVWALEEVSEP